MNVTKRDGRIVEFDKSKIRESVLKAFEEVDGEITPHSRDKAAEIARYIDSLGENMTVEEIQDLVEDKLMASARKDVDRKSVV